MISNRDILFAFSAVGVAVLLALLAQLEFG
jgi:hypothetical protein